MDKETVSEDLSIYYDPVPDTNVEEVPQETVQNVSEDLSAFYDPLPEEEVAIEEQPVPEQEVEAVPQNVNRELLNALTNKEESVEGRVYEQDNPVKISAFDYARLQDYEKNPALVEPETQASAVGEAFQKAIRTVGELTGIEAIKKAVPATKYDKWNVKTEDMVLDSDKAGNKLVDLNRLRDFEATQELKVSVLMNVAAEQFKIPKETLESKADVYWISTQDSSTFGNVLKGTGQTLSNILGDAPRALIARAVSWASDDPMPKGWIDNFPALKEKIDATLPFLEDDTEVTAEGTPFSVELSPKMTKEQAYQLAYENALDAATATMDQGSQLGGQQDLLLVPSMFLGPGRLVGGWAASKLLPRMGGVGAKAMTFGLAHPKLTGGLTEATLDIAANMASVPEYSDSPQAFIMAGGAGAAFSAIPHSIGLARGVFSEAVQSPLTRKVKALEPEERLAVADAKSIEEVPPELVQKLNIQSSEEFDKVKSRSIEVNVGKKMSESGASAIQMQTAVRYLESDAGSTVLDQWLYATRKSTIDKERILYAIDETFKKDPKRVSELRKAFGDNWDEITADSETFFRAAEEMLPGYALPLKQSFEKSKAGFDLIRRKVAGELIVAGFQGIDTAKLKPDGTLSDADTANMRYRATVVYGINGTKAILNFVDSAHPELKAITEKAKEKFGKLKTDIDNHKMFVFSELDEFENIVIENAEFSDAKKLKIQDSINVIRSSLDNTSFVGTKAIRKAIQSNKAFFTENSQDFMKLQKAIFTLDAKQMQLSSLATDVMDRVTSKMILDDRSGLRYKSLTVGNDEKLAIRLASQSGAIQTELASALKSVSQWKDPRKALQLVDDLNDSIMTNDSMLMPTWNAFTADIPNQVDIKTQNALWPTIKTMDKAIRIIDMQRRYVDDLNSTLRDVIDHDVTSSSIIAYAAKIDRLSHKIILPTVMNELGYHRGMLASLWDNVNEAKLPVDLKKSMYEYLTGDVATRIRNMETERFNFSDGHLINMIEATKTYSKELVDQIAENHLRNTGRQLDRELLLTQLVGTHNEFDPTYTFADSEINVTRLNKMIRKENDRTKRFEKIMIAAKALGVDALQPWLEGRLSLSLNNVFARFQEHDNIGKKKAFDLYSEKSKELGIEAIVNSRMGKSDEFKTVLQRLCEDGFSVQVMDTFSNKTKEYKLTPFGKTVYDYVVTDRSMYLKRSQDIDRSVSYLREKLVQQYTNEGIEIDANRLNKEAIGIYNAYRTIKVVGDKSVDIPVEVFKAAFAAKVKIRQMDDASFELARRVFEEVGIQYKGNNLDIPTPKFRERKNFNVSSKITYDVSEYQPLIGSETKGTSRLFGSSDEAQIQRHQGVANEDLMHPMEAMQYSFIRDIRNAATVRDVLEIDNMAEFFKDKGDIAAVNYLKNLLEGNLAWKSKTPGGGRNWWAERESQILDAAAISPVIGYIVHNANVISDQLFRTAQIGVSLVKPAQILVNVIQGHMQAMATGGSILPRVSTGSVIFDTLANIPIGGIDAIFGIPFYVPKVMINYFDQKYNMVPSFGVSKELRMLVKEKTPEYMNYIKKSQKQDINSKILSKKQSYEIGSLQTINNAITDFTMYNFKERVELAITKTALDNSARIYERIAKQVKKGDLTAALDITNAALRTNTKVANWDFVQSIQKAIENGDPYTPWYNFGSAFVAQNVGRYGWFTASQIRNSMSRGLPGAAMFWSSRNLVLGKMLAGAYDGWNKFAEMQIKRDPDLAKLPVQMQSLYASTLLSGTVLMGGLAGLVYGAGSIFTGSLEEMRQEQEDGWARLFLEGLGEGYGLHKLVPGINPAGLLVDIPSGLTGDKKLIMAASIFIPEIKNMYDAMNTYYEAGTGKSLAFSPETELQTVLKQLDAAIRNQKEGSPNEKLVGDEGIVKLKQRAELLQAYVDETFWKRMGDAALQSNPVSQIVLTDVLKKPLLLHWLWANDKIDGLVNAASYLPVQYRPVESMQNTFGRVGNLYDLIDMGENLGLISGEDAIASKETMTHIIEQSKESDTLLNLLYQLEGLNKPAQTARTKTAQKLSISENAVPAMDEFLLTDQGLPMEGIIEEMMKKEMDKKLPGQP